MSQSQKRLKLAGIAGIFVGIALVILSFVWGGFGAGLACGMLLVVGCVLLVSGYLGTQGANIPSNANVARNMAAAGIVACVVACVLPAALGQGMPGAGPAVAYVVALVLSVLQAAFAGGVFGESQK